MLHVYALVYSSKYTTSRHCYKYIICMHTYKHTYVHTHNNRHVHTQTHTHTYIHTCTDVHKYKHTHTHTHTHIIWTYTTHTYKYTQEYNHTYSLTSVLFGGILVRYDKERIRNLEPVVITMLGSNETSTIP